MMNQQQQGAGPQPTQFTTMMMPPPPGMPPAIPANRISINFGGFGSPLGMAPMMPPPPPPPSQQQQQQLPPPQQGGGGGMMMPQMIPLMGNTTIQPFLRRTATAPQLNNLIPPSSLSSSSSPLTGSPQLFPQSPPIFQQSNGQQQQQTTTTPTGSPLHMAPVQTMGMNGAMGIPPPQFMMLNQMGSPTSPQQNQQQQQRAIGSPLTTSTMFQQQQQLGSPTAPMPLAAVAATGLSSSSTQLRLSGPITVPIGVPQQLIPTPAQSIIQQQQQPMMQQQQQAPMGQQIYCSVPKSAVKYVNGRKVIDYSALTPAQREQLEKQKQRIMIQGRGGAGVVGMLPPQQQQQQQPMMMPFGQPRPVRIYGQQRPAFRPMMPISTAGQLTSVGGGFAQAYTNYHRFAAQMPAMFPAMNPMMQQLQQQQQQMRMLTSSGGMMGYTPGTQGGRIQLGTSTGAMGMMMNPMMQQQQRLPMMSNNPMAYPMTTAAATTVTKMDPNDEMSKFKPARSMSSKELKEWDKAWIKAVKRHPEEIGAPMPLFHSHVEQIMTAEKHVLCSFLKRTFDELRRDITQQFSGVGTPETREKIIQLVGSCSLQLVGTFINYHKDFEGSKAREQWLEDGFREFAIRQIHPILFNQYCVKFRPEDELHAAKMREFSWVSPAHMGIAKRFWLSDACVLDPNTPLEKQPYHESIVIVREMEQQPPQDNPVSICDCIVRMQESIYAEVMKYWGDRLSADKLAMGADDFLPVAAYVILRSQLSHPVSLSKYIEDFLPEDEGERQYNLITYNCCLELIKEVTKQTLEQTLAQVTGTAVTTANTASSPAAASPPQTTFITAAGTQQQGGGQQQQQVAAGENPLLRSIVPQSVMQEITQLESETHSSTVASSMSLSCSDIPPPPQ